MGTKELFKEARKDELPRKKTQVDIEAEKENLLLPFEEEATNNVIIDIDTENPDELL